MDAADLAIIETYEAHFTPLERALFDEVRRLQALWREREQEEAEEIRDLERELASSQSEFDEQAEELGLREQEIARMANEIAELEIKLSKVREVVALASGGAGT